MKHYLKDRDWVMWLDADTIITNPDIRLESLLPRSASGPDFVITVDSGGYNAGIWLLRRSEWSEAFLDRWWSMTQFIRVRGSASRVPGNTRSRAAGPLAVCTAELTHQDGVRCQLRGSRSRNNSVPGSFGGFSIV